MDAFGGRGIWKRNFCYCILQDLQVFDDGLLKLFEIFIRVQWNRMSVAIEGMLQFIKIVKISSRFHK